MNGHGMDQVIFSCTDVGSFYCVLECKWCRANNHSTMGTSTRPYCKWSAEKRNDIHTDPLFVPIARYSGRPMPTRLFNNM